MHTSLTSKTNVTCRHISILIALSLSLPLNTQTHTHTPTTTVYTILDVSVPESGTVITEFANASLRLDFFCRLLNSDGSRQILTNWFHLSAEGKAQGRSPGSVQSSTQFTLSGDSVSVGSLNISSSANLTVNGLTTDLHNSTVSCGSTNNNSIAVFTIFAYGKDPKHARTNVCKSTISLSFSSQNSQ